jgi:hypothetical protein
MSKKKFKFTAAQLQWLEALESGKYRKATGALHVYDKDQKKSSFCCLGVACKIFKNTLQLKYEIDFTNTRDYDGESSLLPDKALEYLQLNSDSGEIIIEKLSNAGKKKLGDNTDLVDCNDNGWSHKKIAAFIRKYPEAIFKNND